MTEQRKAKMLSVLRRRQPDLTVVLEDIHDPHNVSAILRTADAVGLCGVQLVYRDTPFPKLGKKSSASAVKWVARRSFRSMKECVDRLHGEGFQIYASHLAKSAVPLYDLDLREKVAFIFGNEHRGVSPESVRLADASFRIPMSGMVQSLNVSVACAVTLYEAFRQRGLQKDSMRISEEVVEKLFAEWTKK